MREKRKNFLITERVLESSKKKKMREGVGERKRDWSSWNVLNEGE